MKMSRFKRYIPLYLMLVPAMGFFLIFIYYPLILGFVISFENYSIIGEKTFIGLQNYLNIFHDSIFLKDVINTFIMGIGILIIGFAAALVVALSLNEIINGIFKKFTQMIIYLPHLFSWVIVGGIWIYLLSPDTGLANEVMKWLTGHQVPFLTDGFIARGVFIFTAIWKDVGFNCILFLAAIVGINPTLYEAAEVDGAGRWRQTLSITIPQLIPTMKVVLLLMVMGFLKIFEQVYIMRNSSIEPKVDVVMTYIFDKGISQFQIGLASAVSILILIATLLITVSLRKAIRYDED